MLVPLEVAAKEYGRVEPMVMRSFIAPCFPESLIASEHGGREPL